MGVAATYAAENGMESRGYRFMWNHGMFTDQKIGHPHVHLIGGRPLSQSLG